MQKNTLLDDIVARDTLARHSKAPYEFRFRGAFCSNGRTDTHAPIIAILDQIVGNGAIPGCVYIS